MSMGLKARAVDKLHNIVRHVLLFVVKYHPVKHDEQCDDFTITQYWLDHTSLDSLLSNSHLEGNINEYQQ